MPSIRHQSYYEPESNKNYSQLSNNLERISERLQEAGVASARFISIEPGTKASFNHAPKSASDITGNYGVYAGQGLILIDIDDSSFSPNLPDTLTVKSPHSGKHLYYKIQGEISNSVHEWGEIRASNQYVVGPGSNLTSCKNSCCNPESPGHYSIDSDRPIATISEDTLKDVLCIKQSNSPSSRQSQGHSATSQTEYEPLPDDFNPESQMQHIRGKDSFKERKSKILDKYWEGKEKFSHLLAGNYISAGFYRKDKASGRKIPDRSKAECALANYLGFWFDRNRLVVRHFFENHLSHETKYHQNSTHRENVLEYAKKVDWTYDDLTSVDARIQVAKALLDLYNSSIRETTKHPEVTKSKSTVHRCKQYFKKENALENPERLSEFISLYENAPEIETEIVPSFSAIAAD